MQVYFDNAATTPVAEEVIEVMLPYLRTTYGNPSSIHSHGREARSAIEKSRKTIANLLNTSPSEIFFTSGGTEADNFAINASVDSLGVKNVISSPLEHHAVLHTLHYLETLGKIKLYLLHVDKQGKIDLQQLEDLLKANTNVLVSLMQANNEIGNLNDLQKIGELCRQYAAYFHSDTVQTIGHFTHDLSNLPIDFIVGSAHKFHGPKGVGFIYINADNHLTPFIHGGAQERNMRGGTENIYGIVGMARALELAYEAIEQNEKHIQNLKKRFIDTIKVALPGVTFNGLSDKLSESLNSVLSVNFPASPVNEMLLFNLDILKISVSAGSACTSGSNVGSHVLEAIGTDQKLAAVRFSFSRYNTFEEVDYVVEELKKIYS